MSQTISNFFHSNRCHFYFAVVTCAPPTKVDNGSFSPDKESYNYGEVVEYSCQTGFKVSEPKSISCSDDGTFKPATPTCTRKCYNLSNLSLYFPNVISAVTDSFTSKKTNF